MKAKKSILVSSVLGLTLCVFASPLLANPYGPPPGYGPGYGPPPGPGQFVAPNPENYRGYYSSFSLGVTDIVEQEGGPEVLDDGMNMNFTLGYRLGPKLALESSLFVSLHNPETVDVGYGDETNFMGLIGLTADLKFFLDPPNKNMRSYLLAGAGIYSLKRGENSPYENEGVVGVGYQAGGGIDFKVGSQVRLGARALYRVIEMGPEGNRDPNTKIEAVTAEATLSVHF